VNAEVVRRYDGGFRGLAKFSIRKRLDGSFQAYHDNPFLESDQDYQPEGEPISGLFADFEAAEAELFRYPGFKTF
jgi:hypothetical protein